MSLSEALGVLGVPEPADIDGLCAFGDGLYARVAQSDFEDEVAVEAAAREHAPEFVTLAEAAARAGDPRAEDLMAAVAQALPELRNLVFLDAADVALASPHFLSSRARSLAGALAERVEATRLVEGLQAYSYLEALTRLGLTDDTGRFRALGVLSTVTLDDSPEFLERLPRLVGLALEQWGEASLEDLLTTLLELPDARTDALFELGQATLRSALEGATLEAVLRGLLEARSRFEAVEAAEEAREDATIFRCALDVVLAFVSESARVSSEASAAAETLSAAVGRRAAYSTRAALGGWATPRRLAEAEWFALANTLNDASGQLGRASWQTPVETLSRVLAAYQASRSLTVVSSDGVRRVLEPTVRTAFVKREGLLEHLRAALEAGDVPDAQLDTAQELLDAVASGGDPGGGDAMGKVWAAAPALAAELGIDAGPGAAEGLARAIEVAPDVVSWMNRQAEARARAVARSADPVVDELLALVLEGLADCQDLTGTVREEFVELAAAVLRFAADRADASRESWSQDIAYLFPPSASEGQFTEDYLQKDVYTWLCNSGLRPFARLEERDIAAGRADVTLTRRHRFVIEVKRELSDASREALLAAYGGQAAAYTLAGPRVSLALVLDLTDHSRGVPSLRSSVWVDEVDAGGETRHVVTIVVRGNRPTPRQTRTGVPE